MISSFFTRKAGTIKIQNIKTVSIVLDFSVCYTEIRKLDIRPEGRIGGIDMSLNATPSAERVHIGFFGRRNAGKSSVVNAVTGQELAVVSDVRGTTTDPVSKAMELLPMGPVLIIDTPGIDDEGALGELRVRKTKQVLNKTDHVGNVL